MLKSERYCLQVSKSNDFNSCVVDTTTNYTSYFREFHLQDTVKHFWRVKVQTVDFHEWGEWSDVWSFVINVAADRPPEPPQNPTPPDSATNVSMNTNLYWWSGDPDVGDTVTYTVYFGQDSVSPGSVGTAVDPSSSPFHEVGYCALPSLGSGTNYYWKIRAVDRWGKMAIGPIWHFTTALAPDSPPAAPTINVPPRCYIDEPCTLNAQTTDPEGDAVRYWFDFGDGTSSGWTSFVPSGQSLKISHTYRRIGELYVKAKAQDTHYQESEWSDSAKTIVGVGPGACWIADVNGHTATKIGRGGSIICTYCHNPAGPDTSHPEFKHPVTLCVDRQDGCVWIASTLEDRVFKVLANGTSAPGFVQYPRRFVDGSPSTPCVDNVGDCWISVAYEKRFVKLDRYTGATVDSFTDPGLAAYQFPVAIAVDHGQDWLWAVESNKMGGGHVSQWDISTKTMLQRYGGFNGTHADVNPVTHDCWVADHENQSVVKISGGSVTRYYGFTGPFCVSVDHIHNVVWVADKEAGEAVKIDFDGNRLSTVHQLNQPSAVEVDPNDGSCWISDPGHTRVIKVSADCNLLFEINSSRFATPMGMSLNPNPEP
jgi:hypothetical protein